MIPCTVDEGCERTCERGTKGCPITHDDPTAAEFAGQVALALEEASKALRDNPQAVSVEEFVARWDRGWRGREQFLHAIEQAQEMLKLDPERSLRDERNALRELLTLLPRYLAAMSSDNAPTFEQRTEARLVRMERLLLTLADYSVMGYSAELHEILHEERQGRSDTRRR